MSGQNATTPRYCSPTRRRAFGTERPFNPRFKTQWRLYEVSLRCSRTTMTVSEEKACGVEVDDGAISSHSPRARPAD